MSVTEIYFILFNIFGTQKFEQKSVFSVNKIPSFELLLYKLYENVWEYILEYYTLIWSDYSSIIYSQFVTYIVFLRDYSFIIVHKLKEEKKVFILSIPLNREYCKTNLMSNFS